MNTQGNDIEIQATQVLNTQDNDIEIQATQVLNTQDNESEIQASQVMLPQAEEGDHVQRFACGVGRGRNTCEDVFENKQELRAHLVLAHGFTFEQRCDHPCLHPRSWSIIESFSRGAEAAAASRANRVREAGDLSASSGANRGAGVK